MKSPTQYRSPKGDIYQTTPHDIERLGCCRSGKLGHQNLMHWEHKKGILKVQKPEYQESSRNSDQEISLDHEKTIQR